MKIGRIVRFIAAVLTILCFAISATFAANDGYKTGQLEKDSIYKNIQVKKYKKDTIAAAALGNEATISIVGTADLHGYIYPLNYFKGTIKERGIAKVATYFNQLKSQNPNTMIIDAGDCTQGTPFIYYYNFVDTVSTYPMMKVMGALGYYSWTLGNHEFNYGISRLDRIINDATSEGIATLSANIYNRDNSNYALPYKIKEFNINGKTIKIGLLGLTAKTIFVFGNEADYNGMKFVYTVNDAKKWVPIMKSQGADIIIAVTHAGESEVNALASSVTGIDAILCGHLHIGIPMKIVKNPLGEDVLITEPLAYGESVSQIDIAVDGEGNITTLTTMNAEIAQYFTADPAVLELIKPYHDTVLNYLNTTLCTATGSLPSKYATVRPTAIMDLINKVQMTYSGCQLSIAAPQMGTSVTIPSGNVKVKDVMYACPDDEDFLVGIKMTGLQLKKWMEYSARYYKRVNQPSDPIVKDPVLDISDSKLDILYGATYDTDLTKPAGSRIRNLKYNGNPITDTDVFTVAITSSRFNNDGSFFTAAGLTPRDPRIEIYNSSKTMGYDGLIVNLLMEYIKDKSVIEPTISDNWKIYTVPVP